MTAEFCFFLFSVSRYIYTCTISHHVLIKPISFLQIFTCWKIVLQNEKQSQTKISLWVLLKKTATETSIWQRQDRRQQPRESIQESLTMKQFLLFWTAHMNPELGNKHSQGGAAVGHAAQWYHWLVSLSYCFWWTLLQEAAIKDLQCHSSHSLGEPLGNMMETNMSPCHREASSYC